MKALSIGRDNSCDIIINDSTNIISRRHAILNISPSGKITIVDQSSNGTYVNGIRISQNVPVPVSRKDTISFAHIAKLDWNRVPKSNALMLYAIIGIVNIIVIVCSVFAYQYKNNINSEEPKKDVIVTDSINDRKTEDIKDSTDIKKEVSKHKKDSIQTNKKKNRNLQLKKLDNKPEVDDRIQSPILKDSIKNNRSIG